MYSQVLLNTYYVFFVVSAFEPLRYFKFRVNRKKCECTVRSAVFLTFSRELRSPDEANNDLRQIGQATENFVPEITLI